MVTIIDNYVDNRDLQIHYLESLPQTKGKDKIPLIYIPGMLDYAENFKREMQDFETRKVISISLRGCGKSSAPLSGYSFEDHYSDVEAVINNSNLNEFYLLAYSMSVPYAINASLSYPNKVKGLIIGDYPSRISKPPKGWAKK